MRAPAQMSLFARSTCSTEIRNINVRSKWENVELAPYSRASPVNCRAEAGESNSLGRHITPKQHTRESQILESYSMRYSSVTFPRFGTLSQWPISPYFRVVPSWRETLGIREPRVTRGAKMGYWRASHPGNVGDSRPDRTLVRSNCPRASTQGPVLLPSFPQHRFVDYYEGIIQSTPFNALIQPSSRRSFLSRKHYALLGPIFFNRANPFLISLFSRQQET